MSRRLSKPCSRIKPPQSEGSSEQAFKTVDRRPPGNETLFSLFRSFQRSVAGTRPPAPADARPAPAAPRPHLLRLPHPPRRAPRSAARLPGPRRAAAAAAPAPRRAHGARPPHFLSPAARPAHHPPGESAAAGAREPPAVNRHLLCTSRKSWSLDTKDLWCSG
ncbi:atherin [Desmodus rotundus]|uniref:atherin n=1 Tax=Desmodus rotundus TaxID=9430 RepID=UPI0023818BA5|nr:basic proline-rich protein-like [Desmodus rotundus]